MIAQEVKRQLLGKAPSAYRTLRLLRWRLRNRRRVVAYLLARLRTSVPPAAAELRREGIVVRTYDEAAAASHDLYEEARQAAERLRDEWLAAHGDGTDQATHNRYRAQFLHTHVDRQSPFIRLATAS